MALYTLVGHRHTTRVTRLPPHSASSLSQAVPAALRPLHFSPAAARQREDPPYPILCAAVARIYSFLPQRSCRDDPLPCLTLRSSGLFLPQYKWRFRRRLLTPLPTWPAAGGGNRRGHGPDVRARGHRSSPGPRTSLCSCPPAAPSTSSSSAHAAEGVGVLLPWASSTSTPMAEGLGF
jgi:hypothetical protein